MLSVLLAAGFGHRLESVLKGKPKSLLNIAGMSLLQRQLENLQTVGATSVVIVVRPEHVDDVTNVLGHISIDISTILVTGDGKSGFVENFCRPRNIVGVNRFILLMIDSIFLKKDLEDFRVQCADLQDEFLVGSTPYVHDEKPSYVIIQPPKQVIGIGRHCGTSKFVTAGIYYCPSDFYSFVDTAIVAGINSLSEYLGFYVRERKPGVQFIFPKMMDVDTPEDIDLVQEWLRTEEHK